MRAGLRALQERDAAVEKWLRDLIDLYDYIAARGGAERARLYRPSRGILPQPFGVSGPRHRGEDLRPGLRVLGFERRAVIALQTTADTVTILRILYGGRDIETVFP